MPLRGGQFAILTVQAKYVHHYHVQHFPCDRLCDQMKWKRLLLVHSAFHGLDEVFRGEFPSFTIPLAPLPSSSEVEGEIVFIDNLLGDGQVLRVLVVCQRTTLLDKFVGALDAEKFIPNV